MSLPSMSQIVNFLHGHVKAAIEAAPPSSTKGRSVAPVLPISAAEFMTWVKANNLRDEYSTFHGQARAYEDHLLALQMDEEEGRIAQGNPELAAARAQLKEALRVGANPAREERIKLLQEELRPLLAEQREWEKQVKQSPEVERLTKKVEEIEASNTEGKAAVILAQVPAHLLDAMRANKEPKLERGQPWDSFFKLYGLPPVTTDGTTEVPPENVTSAG